MFSAGSDVVSKPIGVMVLTVSAFVVDSAFHTKQPSSMDLLLGIEWHYSSSATLKLASCSQSSTQSLKFSLSCFLLCPSSSAGLSCHASVTLP